MKEDEINQALDIAQKASEKKSVSLSTLLDILVEYVRRYVALGPEQADACALWIAHTHVFEVAETTPYLEITSPEKQSGKTRLLEALELVVARPWLTGRVTSAVLYRKIEKEKPTLLLDESDAAFKGSPEYFEVLRGVLNSGYRAGGKVSVCVGQGKNISYQDFSCFSPKAIAGINRLPDTVSDRSITIVMRRRAPGENVDRFRRIQAEERAKPIREELEQWAAANINSLRNARPNVPEELSDRAADCWEPLLAIADAAGNSWADRARKAAIILSGQKAKEDESLGVRLLTDIKQVFAEEEKLFSGELCQRLAALEESPWGALPFGVRRGKEIDPRTLAHLLKPYGIGPKQIKKGDEGKKGYILADFVDVWERYLPSPSKKGNNRNERNYEAITGQKSAKVSTVSDVSSEQDMEESVAFPKFPLFGKEHSCNFRMVRGLQRCVDCGEFPLKSNINN